MISETTNEDCMELMARYPDKWFQLSIVDPPYGIGATKTIGQGDLRKGRTKAAKWAKKAWDDIRPDASYFDELFRVSKNQIIFGGNYFADLLPPSRCWLVWDKKQRVDQADAELCWTSFESSVRVFAYHANFLQGFMNPTRFHPTEKPTSLYRWLLKNYAKQGDKILDTHLGSGSSRIAAWDLGFDFYGCELDEDYFREGNERFERHRAQPKLFTPEIEKPKQTSFLD